jgi:hypothetical protein
MKKKKKKRKKNSIKKAAETTAAFSYQNKGIYFSGNRQMFFHSDCFCVIILYVKLRSSSQKEVFREAGTVETAGKVLMNPP